VIRRPSPADQARCGIDDGRREAQPFNHTGSWVRPISCPGFGNWGCWFCAITEPTSNPTLVPRTPINYDA